MQEVDEIKTKSLAELLAEKDALEAEIKARTQAELAADLAEIKRLAVKHGLAGEQLLALALGKPAGVRQVARGDDEREKKAIPPKYRNPATGESWTGRGLKPKWLAQALGEGKSLDEFLIQQSEAEAA